MIAARRARRLSGVRFEAPPPPVDPLPRMDVAVVVGVAASGPLHVPVAIEDSAELAEIFGEDAPLAWDGARRSGTFAHLAPAVRAFFRNGGRRCFVVRVAGREASAGVFSLPGLFRWGARGPEPMRLRARSEGSWSDAVRAGATLSATPLSAQLTPEFAAKHRLLVRLASREALRPGDLVRLSFRGADGSTPDPGWVGFLEVREVVLGVGGRAEIVCDEPRWFLARAPRLAFGADGLLSTFEPGSALIARVVEPARAAGDDALVVRASMPPASAPAPGALLRFEVPGADGARERLFFTLTRAEADAAAPDRFTLLHGRGLWLSRTAPAAFDASANVVLERLSFQIWTQREGAPLASIADLAFTAAHPRSAWALPTDEELHRVPAEGVAPRPTTRREWLRARTDELHALWDEARRPRFALSGWDGVEASFDAHGAAEVLGLPIGMPLADSPLLAPSHDGRAALERDGLSRLDASMFLDEALADLDGGELLDRADVVRYGSTPRPLRGIHCALDVEEATLIAVPDAVLWPWAPPALNAVDPPAVALLPEEPPAAPGAFASCALRALGTPAISAAVSEASAAITVAFAMEAPHAGARFTLEQATVPAFTDAVVVYEGEDPQVTLSPRAPGAYYLRARATVDGLVTGWSRGVAAVISPRVRQWAYALDPSRAPITAAVHAALLRLSAARGDLFAVLALPERYREEQTLEHLAALAAPDHHGAPHLQFGALYHPWLIVAEEPLPPAPARTFDRAASASTSAPPRLRHVPPDGAALGMLAARAIARGAWIAPANQPFADVVALTPALSLEAIEALDATAVNLVRRASVGFTVLGERTLSEEPERAAIHVRRLLSLLRRVAVRVGGTYVFEPNGQALRRAVQGDLEELLGALFQRGAFAGRAASDCYQVLTDAPIALGGVDDEVVLAVDLRVAPAAPLSFLTVRLVQRGGRTVITEEA